MKNTKYFLPAMLSFFLCVQAISAGDNGKVTMGNIKVDNGSVSVAVAYSIKEGEVAKVVLWGLKTDGIATAKEPIAVSPVAGSGVITMSGKFCKNKKMHGYKCYDDRFEVELVPNSFDETKFF